MTSTWQSGVWHGSPWKGAAWGSGQGESVVSAVFAALTYHDTTYEFLPFKTGTGPATQGRSSERYALNVEDLYYSVPAYEVGGNGGRVVENKVYHSDDLTGYNWTPTGSVTLTLDLSDYPSGFTQSTLIEAAAVDKGVAQNFILVIGRSYVASLWAKGSVGGEVINFTDGTGIVGTDVTVTSGWQRYAMPFVPTSTNHATLINGSGDAVRITGVMISDVTGKSNQTVPDEYVSYGTGAGNKGAEVFDDPSFDAAGSWAIGAGWAISGGEAVSSAGGLFLQASTGDALVIGTSYVSEVTISVSNSGSVSTPYDGFGGNNIYHSAVGTHKIYFVASAANRPYIHSNSFDGTITSASIKKVSHGVGSDGRKVFANANGNTVASNVVTEAVGDPLVELPWYGASPAASNVQVYSNDFTNAAWAKSGATTNLDQPGLTGAPNSASRISGTGGYVYNDYAIPDDSNTHTAAFWFRKESVSTIAAWQLECRGATAVRNSYSIDLFTGTLTLLSEAGTTSYEVHSDGLWWKVLVSLTNNSSGNTLWTVLHGQYWGVGETNDVVMGNSERFLNKTLTEVRGLPPIFTAGAVVSTTADNLYYDILNHAQDQGAYYFEWKPSYAAGEATTDNQNLLDLSGIAGGLLHTRGGGADVLRTHDGTNNITGSLSWVSGQVYKIGLVYDASESKMRICVDGSWSLEGTYDGAYSIATVFNLAFGNEFPTEMRDLRRYDLGYVAAQAQVDDLMIDYISANFDSRILAIGGDFLIGV